MIHYISYFKVNSKSLTRTDEQTVAGRDKDGALPLSELSSPYFSTIFPVGANQTLAKLLFFDQQLTTDAQTRTGHFDSMLVTWGTTGSVRRPEHASHSD